MNQIGSLSNVESVHTQCGNYLSNNDNIQLGTIKIQAWQWKPIHNITSICWGFFNIDDNLSTNLQNSQMLRCIIHSY
jgi:hypothetical protein